MCEASSVTWRFLAWSMAWSFVLGELFTSVDFLQEAITRASDVSQRLEYYVQYEQEKLDSLKEFSRHLSKEQEKLKSNGLKGNPITLYKFSRLYGFLWDDYINTYRKNDASSYFKAMLDDKKKGLPSYEDFEGAVEGLARLQSTYKLNAVDVAKGIIANVDSVTMTAGECISLGDDMAQFNFSQNALEWYHAADNLARTGAQKECIKQENEKLLKGNDSVTCSKEGKIDESLDVINERIKIAETLVEISKNNFWVDVMDVKDNSIVDTGYSEFMLRELNRMYQDGEIKYYGREVEENLPLNRQHKALCRGDVQNPSSPGHVCWHDNRHNHPLLVLSPAKVELVNLQPLMYIYHDIITPSETKAYLSIHSSLFERAEEYTKESGKIDVPLRSNRRVSSYTYMEEDLSYVKSLKARLTASTGLKTHRPYGEIMQLGNYGIGGHYHFHTDFHKESITKHRFATVLIYLTNVVAGGSTVFPALEIAVKPQKGSALFWVNLDDNLEGYEETLHAGCPVLAGSKWIINQWIWSTDQNLQCF